MSIGSSFIWSQFIRIKCLMCCRLPRASLMFVLTYLDWHKHIAKEFKLGWQYNLNTVQFNHSHKQVLPLRFFDWTDRFEGHWTLNWLNLLQMPNLDQIFNTSVLRSNNVWLFALLEDQTILRFKQPFQLSASFLSSKRKNSFRLFWKRHESMHPH